MSAQARSQLRIQRKQNVKQRKLSFDKQQIIFKLTRIDSKAASIVPEAV
jgi:hypothetical protein